MEFKGDIDDARATRAFAKKHLPENYEGRAMKMDEAMKSKMSRMSPEEMKAHMSEMEKSEAKDRCEGSAEHCGEDAMMTGMPAKPGMVPKKGM